MTGSSASPPTIARACQRQSAHLPGRRAIAVDQNVRRLARPPSRSGAATACVIAQHRRVQDVQPVDFAHIDHAHAPRASFANDAIERRPPFGRQLLGIGQPLRTRSRKSATAAGNNRSGKRTPARLVHPDDHRRHEIIERSVLHARHAKPFSPALLPTATLAVASCGGVPAGDSSATAVSTPAGATTTAAGTPLADVGPFKVASFGEFAEPWALDFDPVDGRIFLTEKAGTMKFVDPATGRMGTVTGGLPRVDYGGQGGLGDFAFAPDYATSKAVYLSWAEAGNGDTRGAVVGRGTLDCASATACSDRRVADHLAAGAESHRARPLFAPHRIFAGRAASVRRQRRPSEDGAGAGYRQHAGHDRSPESGWFHRHRQSDGERFARPADQIWSYGHRNILGLQFDGAGRLWDLEHGPKGGDELNLVAAGGELRLAAGVGRHPLRRLTTFPTMRPALNSSRRQSAGPR